MMTLQFFLMCGLVPALVMAAGWLSWMAEIEREKRSRAAGMVPVPGHILALSLMFKVLIPSGLALMAWLLWGLLSWITA